MILVFFILLLIILPIVLIIMSTISIRIQKLKVSNYDEDRRSILNKLEYDYIAYLELHFVNKIKILSVKIDKDKIKQLDLKQRIPNINFENFEKNLPNKKDAKEIIRKLKIDILKFDLGLKVGTEDAIVTSGIIALLSSIIGIILARIIKEYDKTKYKYEIMPIYENKNLINLKLNCIIKVKIVHIIYIIYVLVKKGRVNKYERTSNRRSYDYSYE